MPTRRTGTRTHRSDSPARVFFPFLAVSSLVLAFQACGLDESGITPAPLGTDSGVRDGGGPPGPRPDSGTGDGPHFVGGTVTGVEGRGLTLQNNGGDDLTIERDGAFVFRTQLSVGAAYTVQIKQGALPTSPYQSCTVESASGAMGTADVQSVKVTCSLLRSCKDVNALFPATATDNFVIRPGNEKAIARCDMDYEDGGWTLIETTVDRKGPGELVEAGPDLAVEPGTSRYMKATSMRALAGVSTQIHIRQSTNVTKWVTSKTSATSVIDNLRAGKLVNDGLENRNMADLWTGTMVSTLSFFRSVTNEDGYPDLYWARDNGDGLHLRKILSTWDWFSDSSPAANVSLEVYVR